MSISDRLLEKNINSTKTAMDEPQKLRVMCSYGGHIIPRPGTKSLCYAGGDTRMVSLTGAAAASLSSLSSHLSSVLAIPSPFWLKYQLPAHDLDSLISLLSDDDLLPFLDELRRLGSGPRIRLFVFAARMHHPRSEAWFSDALKGAKIMQKGFEAMVNAGGGEDSAAESLVLDTSSSFGSTSSSSSASLTNLAPVRSNVDDPKLTSSDAIPSEHSGSAVTSCLQTSPYQDSLNPVLVAPLDNRVCPNPTGLEIKGSDISSGIQAQSTFIASSYQLDPNLIHHQKVQYIPVDASYVSHNPQGPMPISSFYPLYHTQLPQHQMVQFQCQPNQPQPIYLLPVQSPQTCNFPRYYHGFTENPALPSSQTQHLTNTYITPPQIVRTEPTQTVHSAIPLVAASAAAPLLHIPCSKSQQQPPVGLYENQHQAKPVEHHDDATHVQIYKSQPPPPCPSQFQTMTKATDTLLSKALDQLHTDSLKQQIKTPLPQ